MAFRDHLDAAMLEKEEVSLVHGMLHHSQASQHTMTCLLYTSDAADE